MIVYHVRVWAKKLIACSFILTLGLAQIWLIDRLFGSSSSPWVLQGMAVGLISAAFGGLMQGCFGLLSWAWLLKRTQSSGSERRF